MDRKDFVTMLNKIGLPLEIPGDFDRIFRNFGSDKSFLFGRGHGYSKFYEELLTPIRFDAFNIAEIGLLSAPIQEKTLVNSNRTYDPSSFYQATHNVTLNSAPSILGWLNFFPFATVIGVDKEPFELTEVSSRCVLYQENQDFPEKIVELLEPYLSDLYVVVDDGSHFYHHQINTFCHIFPLMPAGSVYFIEDIDTIQGTKTHKQPYMRFDKFITQSDLDNKIESLTGIKYSFVANIKAAKFGLSFQTGEMNVIAILKK